MAELYCACAMFVHLTLRQVSMKNNIYYLLIYLILVVIVIVKPEHVLISQIIKKYNHIGVASTFRQS